MAKPSVMVDGYNLALSRGTGIATYARNLATHASELGHRVDLLFGVNAAVGKNRLLAEVGFFDPSRKTETAWKIVRRLMTSPLGLTAKPVPITGSVFGGGFAASLPPHDGLYNIRNLYSFCQWHFRTYGSFLTAAYDDAADIAHWTYPMPVKLKGAANIYTIHDLVPFRLPYATLDNKRRFYKIIRQICDRADHIVTVSEASKRDIVELMGVDERRVTNTYQAVHLPAHLLERREDEVAREVSTLLGLDYKGYYLYFGAIEPKKNVGRIVEAYLASGAKKPLVIVGQVVWRNGDDARLVGANYLGSGNGPGSAASSSIIRLKYLPFPLLVSVIRAANAVIFPSLYEGFGLPILESMMLGTAVVTGNLGSNPEVAGDAALIVDPYDVEAIAGAIRSLDADTGLRDELAARGREQTKLFSPELYARRLGALYDGLT